VAPLDGLRVVDLSLGIAGGYCTKLLVDAGADVVKVEPPGGDPLRRWTASGVDPGGRDGALFRFLHASKRSVVGVVDDAHVAALIATADLVVADDALDIEPASLQDRNPALTVVSITPFGRHGPWAGRPATEFTVQAWCGSTGRRGHAEAPPLAAGGRLGEWIGGTYAAVGALAAARAARADGFGRDVDVALLECMSITFDPFTWVRVSFAGARPPGPSRRIELPSIEPTADGYVGFTTTTAQQFRDFLVLVERPDLLDDPELASADGRAARREEMTEIIRSWTTARTTAECVEQATLLRIPVAPVGNAATLLEMDHFQARGVFVPSADGEFLQPRVPYRIGGVQLGGATPAPRLGQHTTSIGWTPRTLPSRTEPTLPLAGVRVLDFTAFWAGPSATHVLAALGADVVKVESVQRPDGMRYTSTRRPPEPRWWEWGWIFHAVNPAKRGITLDLRRRDGVELAKRLIADTDVVIENFTPRVMEQFGLGWDTVSAANPSVIMLRMPAFGLDGPWRDRTGFAQTMEQLSGMAWVTGWRDGPPVIPGGLCDPLAGMHGVVALLVALEERERNGAGMLIEVTLVECALNAAAEQVVEYTAYGTLLTRDGNRGPAAAPQGVYRCRGDDAWVAIAIATDTQWDGLRRALGEPGWADDPALRSIEGRRVAHDAVDRELERWCARRELPAVVQLLLDVGVPAAPVRLPVDVPDNEQLRGRGFFEARDHEVVGTHEYPAVPFAFADRPRPWLTTPAPTLGQNNDAVLGNTLGVGAVELARLRAEHVVGEEPVSG
jgi:crotonobetainyl-CoA:carnitine CoA-transferase CaiB-like acyl-CoA transferase